MKRRVFIALIGGAVAAWPLAARAQQQAERKRSIGVLLPLVEDDPSARALIGAFVMALQEVGWTDGRNARIEIRWAGPAPSDIRRHIAELVALGPEVLLAYGFINLKTAKALGLDLPASVLARADEVIE